MDLHDMHIWFRQYAQQMGMQNVRAILPEQIDLLINTSINDVVNQLIRENIGITNDRVITDNSKIGQINAFRTLYRVKEFSMYNRNPDSIGGNKAAMLLSPTEANIGKMSNYDLISDNNNQLPNDYLFLVDFSLNYFPAEVGYNAGYNSSNHTYALSPELVDDVTLSSTGQVTNYFPIRVIDDAYLADTLNDFILKPRLRTPIMVVYSSSRESSVGTTVYDLYIDKFYANTNTDSGGSTNGYRLEQSLLPYRLRMSYIAKPAQVKYVEDLTGNAADNINCDLPDSLHVDILKHAVDLYRTSVSGALYTTQQQADNNAREAQRNNYRNENN